MGPSLLSASPSPLSSQPGYPRRVASKRSGQFPEKGENQHVRLKAIKEPPPLQPSLTTASGDDAAPAPTWPDESAQQRHPRWPLFALVAALVLNLAYVGVLGWLAFQLIIWLLR